jgi:bla regulator protein blaR1
MPRPWLLIAIATCLNAQTAFEVASVKPADPKSQGMSMAIEPGGRLTATNVSLRSLLREAYGIRDFQIVEPPPWFDSQRYDVSAKGEGASDAGQIKKMLQSLLVDRFQLEFHHETKEVQAYLLTVGKNGPKLKLAQDTESSSGVRRRGVGRLTGIHASTGQLAEALSDIALNGRHILDRPVLDRTNLTGFYDFALEWSSDPEPSDGTTPDNSGQSIFTAVQEQLGLKLETHKAPVEMFIIDHVEKASNN